MPSRIRGRGPLAGGCSWAGTAGGVCPVGEILAIHGHGLILKLRQGHSIKPSLRPQRAEVLQQVPAPRLELRRRAQEVSHDSGILKISHAEDFGFMPPPMPSFESSATSVDVLVPQDVIFSEITAGLNFYQHHWKLAWILHPVNHTQGDVDRLIFG